MKAVLHLLVTNRPGVLDRIVGLIRRRSWNIDSLTVGDVGDGISQITLRLEGRSLDIEALGGHLEDIDAVRQWRTLTEADGLLRELLLFAIPQAEAAVSPPENTRVLACADGICTCEYTDTPERVDALAQALHARGIHSARSGPLPLLRGEGADAHA